MKSLLKIASSVIIISSVLCGHLIAQEIDDTQYYLNLPSVNAGFTGIENFTDVKLSVRQGWNNFGIINSSYYLSAYGSLNSSFQSILRNNSLRISDPSIYNEIQNNKELRKKLRRKHGLGGMIRGRNIGPYKATMLFVNYAYHIPLSAKLNLTLGSVFGYNNRRIDYTGYTVRDDFNDLFYQQLISSGQGVNNSMTIDFGVTGYTENMYFAISSTGLVKKETRNDNAFGFDALQGYLFQSGKVFALSPNMELNAGVKVGYLETYDLNWGINARFRYRKVVYAGISYENKVKTSALLGATLEGKYNINYAYDYYTSAATNFKISVHEIIIGVSLFNKYQLPD